MKTLGVVEAKVRGVRLAVQFHPTSPVDPGSLVELVQADRRRSLQPDGTLAVPLASGEGADLLAQVSEFLSTLEGMRRRLTGAAAGRAAEAPR